MNTVVARVLRVLTGQSPIALVHAIDELGHEHKLELPAATVRGVTKCVWKGAAIIVQCMDFDLVPGSLREL